MFSVQTRPTAGASALYICLVDDKRVRKTVILSPIGVKLTFLFPQFSRKIVSQIVVSQVELILFLFIFFGHFLVHVELTCCAWDVNM